MWDEKKIRIIDIADELGVSTATVSNVIAVSTPLHIEAVEAKVVSLRGGCIVIAHPLHQILHFFGAIDNKAGGGERLCGRATFAGIYLS